MFCGSWDGGGAWERMDICICMAESLCCLLSQHCQLVTLQEKIKLLKKNKWHERIHSRTHPAHKERGGLLLHRTRRVLISLWACVIRSTWRGFMEKRTSWCWSPNIRFFRWEESTSKIKETVDKYKKKSLGVSRAGRVGGQEHLLGNGLPPTPQV